MRKSCIFLLLLPFSLFCFAKPAPEPEWFRNIRQVYPNSTYLAQRGSGDSAEKARTDAASQLARYFQTTVSANLSTTMSSITSGTNIEEETRVVDEVNVTSEVEFIGLEFTESYYYKPEKKWYAVAYFERNEAWIQFRPRIEAERAKFNAYVKKAESEEDPFTRISLYKSAWNASGDFIERLEYGRIINPGEEEKYSADRDAVSELPSKIEKEKRNLTLAVKVSGDYGNIIENAVRSGLEKLGFIVGTNGNYAADVVVSSNPSGENPVAIMPAVSVSVSNADGRSVLSFEAGLAEKTVAYTLENAQKKAFPKLAERVTEVLAHQQE